MVGLRYEEIITHDVPNLTVDMSEFRNIDSLIETQEHNRKREKEVHGVVVISGSENPSW